MQMENEILIEAPAAHVWGVYTDVERWPEWTPSVTRATRRDDGPLALGSTVRLKQPGMVRMDWTVTELTEGRSWRWVASSPGITTAATHEVTAIDGARCTVRQVITHEGALAGLVGRLSGARTRRYLDEEVSGLKRECEEPARTRAESP